ncbi:MAG: PAS domain-containing protein, partial [Deltaproteobacteria bacterium]|nr:PAS domain-containing protein [Deltaproteobacteria bacterium]
MVPLVLFGTIMWQEYRVELRTTRQEVLRTTEIFQQHALNVFETHQLIAENVNDRLRGMSWDEIGRSAGIRAHLVKVRDVYPQVVAIWLADSSGIVRNASEPLPAKPVSVADRDYFQALRTSDAGMFVGHLVTGHVTGKTDFNLARRREGGTGRFDGVIITSVHPGYFSEFWNRSARHSDFGTALVRGDGKILARAPRLNPAVLTLHPSNETLKAIRRGEQDTYVGMSKSDATKRMYAVRRIGNLNVYLVNGIGMKVILAHWKKDLAFYGAVFVAATAALLLLSLLALKQTREAQRAVRHWQDLAIRLKESTGDLRIITQRLQLATVSGRLGIWDLNVPENILIWDDRMYELYGLSRDVSPGGVGAWEGSLHPDDRDSAVEAYMAALRGEKGYDTDFRVVLPGGSVRHIKAMGV